MLNIYEGNQVARKYMTNGGVSNLSQLLCHIARLLFISAILPATYSAQTPSPHQTRSQGELATALLKLDISQRNDIEALIDINRSYITTSLWTRLIDFASAAYYLNSPERSLEIYQIALIVAERLKDKGNLATTHYHIGRAYAGIDRARDAIEAYLMSKKLFEEAGLQRDILYILSGLGSLHLYLHDYEQARTYSEQSLKLADSLKNSTLPAGAWPDNFGVANATYTLGGICEYEGNYPEAINYFQRSLEIYEALDKGSMRYGIQIISNMTMLGRVFNAIDDNVQALIYLNRALEMSKGRHYRKLSAGALNSLGVLYLEQEDYDKASYYFTQCLQVYQELKNQSEMSRALLNLGVIAQRRGNYDQALESFKTCLQKASEVSNKDVMIAAKQGIGAIYRIKKNYSAALEALDSGLSLAGELKDKTRIAEVLWRKAEVYYVMANHNEAAALAEEALKIAQHLRFSNLSYHTATLLGLSQFSLKKTDLAVQTLSRAIDHIEQNRERVAGQELERQLYFENKLAPYHALIELLIEQNKPFDALVYVERAKGRVLLDVLRSGRTHLTKAMTDVEKEEEQRLNQLIVSLNNQLRTEQSTSIPDASRVSQLSRQLETARLKYASFQNLLYASHPELKRQRGNTAFLTPASLEGLDQSLQTAILEYIVTRDRVYLFVLTRKVQGQPPVLDVIEIAVKEDELRKRVNKFHSLIANRHLTFATPSRDLYDLLLKPAEALLEGKSMICVVPDGVLWDVPFQALSPRAGHFLIEDYSVYYAPSISVLIEMEREKSPGTKGVPESLLAFGNPVVGKETVKELQEQQRGEALEPLPAAETEVLALREIFSRDRSQIFTGARAEEKVFKSLSPRFKTIHLATHGILDNRHPIYSYLLLSRSEGEQEEDGLLEAREIMELKLDADLAVLSACETARGRIGAGEGVIGMSWAFFVAGCRTTIVSQWKVNSASTSELMINFYQGLKGARDRKMKTKAEGLRMAALAVMNDRRYGHPYYWAGFVMVGSNK